MTVDIEALRAAVSKDEPPFALNKIGHVVLLVADLKRSVEFYTSVLGFKVSDIYGDDMMPGGMVFMRFNPDHHGVALVGSLADESKSTELNHIAFEVATLDEVLRAKAHIERHGVTPDFAGRRRAGCRCAAVSRCATPGAGATP